MKHDKFLQPVDGIKVTKRSGIGTLLTPDAIEMGRQRIAAGENPDDVALDLAFVEIALIGGAPEEEDLKTLARGDDMDAIAAAHEAAFDAALRYAFLSTRVGVNWTTLRLATTQREAARLLVDVPAKLKAVLKRVLIKPLTKTLKAGGEAALAKLPQLRAAAEKKDKKKAQLLMRFDVTNPETVKWIKAYALELATNISDTTKEIIKETLTTTFEEGGLDTLHDDILLAIGDDARAQRIARWESMSAANQGQREAWDQAMEQGFLSPTASRVWIATVGACPECQDLDGTVTKLNENYPDPGGNGPPQHPNCRCTEGIA